jgi:hypothetical protein
VSLRPGAAPADPAATGRPAAGQLLAAAARPLLLAGAAGIGLAAGWAESAGLAPLAVLAVGLAATNGYAKAYSP